VIDWTRKASVGSARSAKMRSRGGTGVCGEEVSSWRKATQRVEGQQLQASETLFLQSS
jgi:hypothetical protein